MARASVGGKKETNENSARSRPSEYANENAAAEQKQQLKQKRQQQQQLQQQDE